MAKKAPARRARTEESPERRGAAVAEAPPLALDKVLGQERAIGLLMSAVRSGRVHHAWIFHGPEGVGKFTTAMAWAGVLLDPTSRERATGRVEPDAGSVVQDLWRRRAHPDLHVIRKELAAVSRDPAVRAGKQVSIPREVVAEFLTEPAARTRVLAGDSLAGKVFIVDEAELLNEHSQTILLKTIEEPPEGTVIILVTSREHALRATIRSRCQRVAFGALSDESMRRWVESAGVSASAEDLAFLMRFAEGSPGVLRAALEGGLAEWPRALRPMLDEALQGRFVPELGPAMAERVERYASGWVESRPGASKDAANRHAAGWMFRLVALHLRGGLEAGAEARAFARAAEAIAGAERYLDANVALAFVFESLSAEISAAFEREVRLRR